MSDLLALVGSDTLIGREIRDLVSDKSLGLREPAPDLRLISTENQDAGILSEQAGEPVVTMNLQRLSLADADGVFLAGSPASSRLALELAPEVPFIDLTYALEDHPRSRLRAPVVEPPDYLAAADAIHSIAHPAAIALVLALGRIAGIQPIARSIALVFEPASERGAEGIDELQAQTVSLLSFKSMPKKVFDAQLAFAMLAEWGEEAPGRLDEIESRIERHVATLLQNTAFPKIAPTPMPSIRLVQAPVFHGYSFSLWIEFEEAAPPLEILEKAMQQENIDVRGSGAEPPNNAGMAGQNGIAIGAVSRDRNHPRALWVWMAADNLRLAAQNAVLVARELL